MKLEEIQNSKNVLEKTGRISVFFTRNSFKYLLDSLKNVNNAIELAVKTTTPRYKVLYKLVSMETFLKLALNFSKLLGYISSFVLKRINNEMYNIVVETSLEEAELKKVFCEFYIPFLSRVSENIFRRKVIIISFTYSNNQANILVRITEGC